MSGDSCRYQRIDDAQKLKYPVGMGLCEGIEELAAAHAAAIGCPMEYILVPCLSVVAGLMGVNAELHITSEWPEPSILWTIVCGRTGQRKSPAIGRVKAAVDAVEALIRKTMEDEGAPETSDSGKSANRSAQSRGEKRSPCRQLTVHQFTIEALHNVMLNNEGQAIAVYDEMDVFLSSLDAYKHSSSTYDRSTLLELWNGLSWSRTTVGSRTKIEKTAFSFTGGLQPEFLVDRLQQPDPSGFHHRLLVAVPEEVYPYLEDLKVTYGALLACLER